MGNLPSQPEQPAQPSEAQEQTVPLDLCGTKPLDVALLTKLPGEHYVKHLWEALDCTEERSERAPTSRFMSYSGSKH